MDDQLQHYGVKGMKWGVIRKGIIDAGNAHIKKKKAREQASLEKYHTKNKNNAKYKKLYDKHSKKASSHTTAVRRARKEVKKSSEPAKVALAVTALAVTRGLMASGALSQGISVNPATVRRGKNIVQALKNSPIRYVDGSTLKNVINP